MEMPKQHWRIKLGRSAQECAIFLNDEPWNNIASLKIEAGVNHPTRLTLELIPHEVMVDIPPSLEGDFNDGFFRERSRDGA